SQPRSPSPSLAHLENEETTDLSEEDVEKRALKIIKAIFDENPAFRKAVLSQVKSLPGLVPDSTGDEGVGRDNSEGTEKLVKTVDFVVSEETEAKFRSGVAFIHGVATSGPQNDPWSEKMRKEYILSDIRTWLQNDQPEQRMFWLKGVAGSGKSLCGEDVRSGIETTLNMEEMRNWTLAYFFATLVLEPLKKIADRRMVITIDALDELEEEDIAEFLGLIARAWSQTPPPNVRLIVTSRPKSAIDAAFKGFKANVIELSAEKNETDILLYSEDRMKQLRQRLGPLEDPSVDDLQHQLAAKVASLAGGLFIWIVVVYNDILSSKKVRDIAGEVDKLAMPIKGKSEGDKNVPDSLKMLYRRVFDSAYADLTEEESLVVQSVLGALLLLRRPVSEAALACLLATPVER
ncbi:hypothetical protein HK405_006182, partial [Cladochytrium tenue]